MSFRVSESGTDIERIITLEEAATGTKADIYAFGCLLNSFSIRHNNREKNMIFGFQDVADAKKNITPLFQSAKLSPFVCRLKEGRYTFANHKYKIEKYYNHREAIHGLVFDEVFAVTEKGAIDDSAFVTLCFDYNKTDAGFPFFYRIAVTYQLQSGNHLTITTRLTNLSTSAIPVSDGWHPYFTFGKKADELELFLNTTEIVEFDNRLLPTGHFLPYTKFAHPQQIADTQFDNCFVLDKSNMHAACIIADTTEHIRVSIYPDNSYPFLQIFIPDNRNAIAVENLSSLPDAFNNAIGLLILEPSQSHQFTTSFVIQTW